jgi:hypothetical protein
MDTEHTYLPNIDWDHDVQGTWTEDGEYDPDAKPVVLSDKLEHLLGEA